MAVITLQLIADKLSHSSTQYIMMRARPLTNVHNVDHLTVTRSSHWINIVIIIKLTTKAHTHSYILKHNILMHYFKNRQPKPTTPSTALYQMVHHLKKRDCSGDDRDFPEKHEINADIKMYQRMLSGKTAIDGDWVIYPLF